MKSGRSLTALAQELDRQLESKKDYVVPSPLVHHTTSERGDTVLEIDAPETPRPFEVTPLARRQLADKLKIPFAYFDRMRTEQPALLDRNVNTWLQQDEARPMLRTLDGRVRAVLSNRYRCLDNYDLAESVLPVLRDFTGGTFESVELTETRMYIKFILPRVQHEMRVGDVVQAGIVIMNSEVGQGTLAVQPLVYRLVCSNGMIAADQSIRKTHLGRALGSDDGVTIFEEDTLKADDMAFFLRLRDVVRSALSQETFLKVAMKMQKTMGIELKSSAVKTVEVLRQRYTLTEEEGEGVLSHLIRGGELSGYGLVNAVTRYSQDVPDYDRATEFEALGGKLIELSSREWKGLAEAA